MTPEISDLPICQTWSPRAAFRLPRVRLTTNVFVVVVMVGSTAGMAIDGLLSDAVGWLGLIIALVVMLPLVWLFFVVFIFYWARVMRLIAQISMGGAQLNIPLASRKLGVIAWLTDPPSRWMLTERR